MNIVGGWAIVAVLFAAIAVLVGSMFGVEAGRWFFVGAISVIIASMVVVGFPKWMKARKEAKE